MPAPAKSTVLPASATPLLEPLRNCWQWILAGGCWIQDRETHALLPLIPNRVQCRVFRAMLRQAAAGKPIRIAVPKYRRGGVSTIVQVILWYLCATLERRRAGTFAHTANDTTDIFEIAKIVHDHGGQSAREGQTFIRFNKTRSLYACRTAGARGVKRGSGLTYLHVTELAYLQSLKGMDANAIASLLATVADSPHTIICVEGTGCGPSGEFHRIVMNAAAGKGDYELVFLPWNDDDRNVREVPPDWEITPEEHALMAQFQLSDAQLAWRRAKIADAKDVPTFKREYPLTVSECFVVQTGLVYGSFNAAPLDQKGHIGRMEIKPAWMRYRAIDWGWTESQPFVCLWIAHCKSHPPRLIIDPSCTGDQGRPGLIEEFALYARDPKTGEPIDKHNHGLDALRYVVTTFHLTGLVYCYRALYIHNGNVLGPSGCLRQIYLAEGVSVGPEGQADDMRAYADKVKTKYAGTVADRSQPGIISDYHKWGITGIKGQTSNVPKLTVSDRKDVSIGTNREVEDGIAYLQGLITGNALLFNPPTDILTGAYKKMQKKASDGRDRDPQFSKREREAMDRAKRQRERGRAIEV